MRMIDDLLNLVDTAQWRHWQADIAESVVHFYERKHPGDARLHDVIQIVRRYADGDATDDELDAAHKVAVVVAKWPNASALLRSPETYAAACAANAVAYAAWRAKNAIDDTVAFYATIAVAASPDHNDMSPEWWAKRNAAMDRYTALLAWYVDGATGDKPSISVDG